MFISVVTPISSVEYVTRLQACLNSVISQEYPLNKIEILVTLLTNSKKVNSIGRIETLCESFGARLIHHVHGKKHWPPSLSRNVGYREAVGDVLVSLDADAVLDPRTFGSAIDHIKKRSCAVRVRTSLVPYPPGSPIFFQLGEQEFMRAVDTGRKAPGPGCCILATREAVWKIHGWDEAYVGYGPADWDFVERLEKAGYPVVNLSETDNIWTLHQDHKRNLGTPVHHKNRAYHERSKMIASPIRNKNGWGGA